MTHIIHTVLRSPALEEWFKRVGTDADGIRDEAAAFGKSVHAGLAAHLQGSALVPLDMPDGWQETIEAGRRWLDANIEEVLAVEQPIASAKYGYAGRPDLYGRRFGRKAPCFVDFKTTADLYWSHLLQLAAYRKAGVETYGDKPAERIVLVFSKDEPGKITAHTLTHHDRDFAAFTYCLGLYNIIQGGIS